MKFYKETPPPMLARYDMEFFEIERREASFLVTAHIHSATEILYITDGEFTIKINGQLFNVYPGDMVLIPSNAIHSVYHSNNNIGKYYVLKFTTQYLFNIFKGAENSACLLAFLRNEQNGQRIFKAKNIPYEIKNILDKMICEYNLNDDLMLSAEKAYASVLAVSLFRAFFSSNSNSNDIYISQNIISLIHESVEYINLNCSSNITAEECSKRANISYSYYAKLFHLIIGKSFKEYLIDIRMAKAYNLLITSELSITDIATSCGYNSPAYFTAEYKKHFLTTPSKTRKNIAKNIN